MGGKGTAGKEWRSSLPKSPQGTQGGQGPAWRRVPTIPLHCVTLPGFQAVESGISKGSSPGCHFQI